MITEFPALVYRCPGAHPGPHGKTYDTLPVTTPDALEAALRDGWHWSLEDAALALPAPVPLDALPAWPNSPSDLPKSMPEPAQKPIDERTLLVAQAEKLGIDVDGRWSERRLRREIEAAIQATAL